MAGAIGKSTEILHAMQSLIKLPEISQAMMELSKEMSKVRFCVQGARVLMAGVPCRQA